VLSAFLNRFLFLPALLLIFGIITGCTCQSDSNSHETFLYAETQALLKNSNRESVIKRRLYISPEGVKAVYSDIETTTDLSGFKTVGRRTLSEFLVGDSLYIFDSEDSLFMVGTISDFNESNFDFFPLSAAWLFNTKGTEAQTSEPDTLNVAGFICRKKITAEGYLWMYGNQPMARIANTKNISCSEQVIHSVSDTTFNESFFVLPSGYIRIVPSK
jgi:hypothetical protein